MIQQDNARPHITAEDEAFKAVCDEMHEQGYTIQLTSQPPNSPDLNVLDLGFFSSIQSLQHQKAAHDITTMLKAVEDSFSEYPPEKLDDVFLTLQTVYNEIIKCQGDNTFKIPHIKKQQLRQEGSLTSNLMVSEEARAVIWNTLSLD